MVEKWLEKYLGSHPGIIKKPQSVKIVVTLLGDLDSNQERRIQSAQFYP